MSKLTGVPLHAVPSAWPDVAPYVERCFEKAKEHRFEVEDIHHMLLNNELQLWVVSDDRGVFTVILTQIVNYPRARECINFLTCGEFPEDWREISESLVTWAKSIGCTHVSGYMRKGLAKRTGWDERQTYCVRGLK